MLASNAYVSMQWQSTPHRYYAIQSTPALTGAWGSAYGRVPGSPGDRTSVVFVAPTNSTTVFYRIAEAQSGIVSNGTNSLGGVPFVSWTHEPTNWPGLRTTIGLGDTDGDGEYDTLTRDDLAAVATSSFVTVFSTAAHTNEDRVVTTRLQCPGLDSNACVRFTSLMTDSWGTVSSPISTDFLRSIAELNLPSVVEGPSNRVDILFPKTAITSAVDMEITGDLPIVNVDPLLTLGGNSVYLPTVWMNPPKADFIPATDGKSVTVHWFRPASPYHNVSSHRIKWSKWLFRDTYFPIPLGSWERPVSGDSGTEVISLDEGQYHFRMVAKSTLSPYKANIILHDADVDVEAADPTAPPENSTYVVEAKGGGGDRTRTWLLFHFGDTPLSCHGTGYSDASDGTQRVGISTDNNHPHLLWGDCQSPTPVDVTDCASANTYVTLNSKWGTNKDSYIRLVVVFDHPVNITWEKLNPEDDDLDFVRVELQQ